MALAHSPESLSGITKQTPEEVHSHRKPRRIRALASAAIHALPDEVRGLRDTFRQARSDMASVRELANDPEATHVSRFDVMKYMIWRYGIATPYQVGDDVPGLVAFMKVQESFNTPVAYAVTGAASTALAFGIAAAERAVQTQKAHAQGLDTVAYEGPMGHKLLDSTVNSAPWNVMQTASEERQDGDSVRIITPAQALAMSGAYGLVNTGFYAGALAVPGLNSWTAFGASLGVMYWAKGTIRGYQENMAAAGTASDKVAGAPEGFTVH